MEAPVLYAFLLTLGAGLATGIGSAIAFFANHTNRKYLSFSLGVSAGVMIYVSFVEILHGAQISLEEILGVRGGMSVCALAFFGGMLLSALIDRIVPSAENPHEFKSVENMDAPAPRRHRMMRTGLLTALVVGIHNFPEGIATFMASVDSTEIGLAIAAAIAIHNIPEGIAVSVPVYYATGSRKKAFWYSFLSGISEPVGALAAYLVLMPFMSPVLLNCVFAAVAGIMVFISLDELLPAGQKAYVAAPMRWCGAMLALKDRLPALHPYCARVICSSYLPDWRPGVDYRTVYSAHKAMGGGVTIDLIHEWDYLVELFGVPEKLYNFKGTYSDLEIDSDDLSVYIARYPTLLAEVHLDYFGRGYRRSIELFCHDGSYLADFGAGTLTLPDGTVQHYKEDVNRRYEREMEYFVDYALTGSGESCNPPALALNVLKLTLGENVQ